MNFNEYKIAPATDFKHQDVMLEQPEYIKFRYEL